MKLLNFFGAAAVVIAVAALLACPAGADIINGSFETGDFTGWHWQTSLSDALVVSGGTDGAWQAQIQLYGQYVELPSGRSGFGRGYTALWQEVVVPTDAQYLLFDAWVEGYAYGQMHVHEWGEMEPDVFVYAGAPTTYAIDVSTLRGALAPFMFACYDTDVGDNNLVHLDNVRFTDVSEPSSILLMASGMAGLLRTAVRKGR